MKIKQVLGVILFLIPIFSIASILFSDKNYFSPYYDEEFYKRQEKLFNNSQYRQKNPTSLIADEVVFRYASGAYVRGVDPILINSEHTPLGKYIIGFSYLFFGTEAYVLTMAALFSLFAMWLLSRALIKDSLLSIIPVALFSMEPVFRNQLIVTPLLDIIQLPFILASLVAFLYERKRGRYLFTSILLGLTMATKSLVPGILLIICMAGFLLLQGHALKNFKVRPLLLLFLWLPVSAAVLIASYVRTFMDGHTFLEFLGFQKWIIQYQQSKLIYPLSFWRLMFFNQWQAWWGEKKIMLAVDWNLTWPIITIMPFVGLLLIYFKKIKINESLQILFFWIFVYEAFLSLGIISTRFLLPLLPVLYIIATYIVIKLFWKTKV